MTEQQSSKSFGAQLVISLHAQIRKPRPRGLQNTRTLHLPLPPVSCTFLLTGRTVALCQTFFLSHLQLFWRHYVQGKWQDYLERNYLKQRQYLAKKRKFETGRTRMDKWILYLTSSSYIQDREQLNHYLKEASNLFT